MSKLQVPEGHMTVARRFIAGCGTIRGLRPGGDARIPPRGEENVSAMGQSYFLAVPPGHSGTATALNAEMSKL
jgi:hypothetical protein